MRTAPKLAIVGGVAVLVVAAPAVRAIRGQGAEQPVAYTDLTARLGPIPFPRPTGRVFVNRAALTDFVARELPGAAPTVPTIDFSHRKAVLVALGPRSSSGYALRVVSVSARSGHVRVVFREQAPTLSTRVVPGLTYPYRLITIPRLRGSTIIHLEGQA